MKNLLKNKKLVAFVLAVVGAAAVSFLGVDKETVGKITSGCQAQIDEQVK